MSSLLPPNLLRMFAPRPPLPYLPPLTKDDSDRGPNKLSGIGSLVKRLRDEAEEAELKQGLEDKPAADDEVKKEAEDGADEKMAVDEDGEVKDGGAAKDVKGKGKAKKSDAVTAAGVIGQEAVKMRRELRKKRQEEYKKGAEKDCELKLLTATTDSLQGTPTTTQRSSATRTRRCSSRACPPRRPRPTCATSLRCTATSRRSALCAATRTRAATMPLSCTSASAT